MPYTTRPCPIDIAREFPDLAALKRYAIRLHPRSAYGLSHTASKMGGSFANPKGSEWPSIDQKPAIPVLQILRSDLDPWKEYPGIGISFPAFAECFQLLWVPGWVPGEDEPEEIEGLYPKAICRWLTAEDLVHSEPREIPRSEAQYGDQYHPRECSVNFELIEDFPDRWALSEYIQEVLCAHPRYMELVAKEDMSDNPMAYYQIFMGAAPCTKLGGHPAWVQSPEWPQSARGYVMDYLLTISTWEWDSASYKRWKPIEDGDPDKSQGPIDDADLMIGDAGDAYVFIGKQKHRWPLKVVMQCS